MCEAHIGWHNDYLGAPVLDRCSEVAVVTNKVAPGLDVPIYLCEKHAHLGEQNPKSKNRY